MAITYDEFKRLHAMKNVSSNYCPSCNEKIILNIEKENDLCITCQATCLACGNFHREDPGDSDICVKCQEKEEE